GRQEDGRRGRGRQVAGRPGSEVGAGVHSRRLRRRGDLQDAHAGSAGRQGARQASRQVGGEGTMGGRRRALCAVAAWAALLPAAAGAGTLEQVRARGALRWGADEQGGEPYAYEDPARGGALVGFEVDLAAALARALGVRPVFVQSDWSTLIPSLERGSF